MSCFLRAHVQSGYHVIRITYLLSIQLKCDTYIIWLWADTIICPVLRSQQLHFLPLGPSNQSVVLCELHGMDPGDILREAVAPGGGGTNIVQQSWQELVVKGDLRTSTQCDNNQWTTKQSRPTNVGVIHCTGCFPPAWELPSVSSRKYVWAIALLPFLTPKFSHRYVFSPYQASSGNA